MTIGKKILILLCITCLMIFCIGCNQQDDSKTWTIPEDALASQLSFDLKDDQHTSFKNAIQVLRNVNQITNLDVMVPTTTQIALTNDKTAQINPYEELIYTCSDQIRELKYRYMCRNDLEKFDVAYVQSIAKTIFGVDLSDHELEEEIKSIIEQKNGVKKGEIFPVKVETESDITITIALTHTESGDYILTALMEYGFYSA